MNHAAASGTSSKAITGHSSDHVFFIVSFLPGCVCWWWGEGVMRFASSAVRDVCSALSFVRIHARICDMLELLRVGALVRKHGTEARTAHVVAA